MIKKYVAAGITLLVFLVLTAHTNKKQEEGMYLLSDLGQIDLAKTGLKLTREELFNPNGTSLVDAIVRVGGCTGSFVSDDGLIVTNHHCAFGFVQQISSTKNNYIRDGFLARTRGEETLAKGLVCKITASYADVSAEVLAGANELTDPNQRLQLIGKNIRAITERENKQYPGLQCEISEMFTGRTYVLFRYKLLKDVRLVYVPARSIGEYGGELDNWVWPRHSGDFAFLRAYVAPDGSAAEYSEKNVPYKPARFLKVNPKGVRENDYVFILGYPGRTFRHQPAGFFRYHEQFLLKYISDHYDWQIARMQELSKGNDSLAIRYAGREKSLANVTKNYKGKLQGFRRTGLAAQKKSDEQQLQQFIMTNPELKQKYADVIPRINTLYDDMMAKAPRNLWFDFIYSTNQALQMAATVDNYADAYRALKTPDEQKAFMEKQLPRLKQAMSRYTSSYDAPFEISATVKMLEDAKQLSGQTRIAAADEWVKKYKLTSREATTQFVARMHAKSIFGNPTKAQQLFDKDPVKFLLMKDGMTELASALNDEINPADDEDRARESELNVLMAKYVDAKSSWKSRQFIPDANGTLRFTYGFVKGYMPNDGEYNKPFTTLSGVIEKESTEYELLDAIKQLYAQRDFGQFMHPDLNDLPVNILYNLDTTGGNSGSPVMNDRGELIGVNFDRAYTATINDYAWNESYSRSVAVDIRYVLWVVQKVAKAQYLLDEMGVKQN